MKKHPFSTRSPASLALATALAVAALGHASTAAAASCDFIGSSTFIDLAATSSDGSATHEGTVAVTDSTTEITNGQWLYRSAWQLDNSLDGGSWLPIHFLSDDFTFTVDLSDDSATNHRTLTVTGTCNGTSSVTGAYTLTDPFESGTITLTRRP